MKILVTGAAGFVGSNLLNALIDSGYQAMGVDDLSFGYEKNVNNQNKLLIKPFQDLSDDFINDFDILVHCACANIIFSQDRPIDTFKINTLNTINLFQRFKGKIIYTSTASVYGQAKEIPTPENAIIQTRNAYDQSKYISELYIKEDYAILRLSNVYGPNQRPENPYAGVISKFIQAAIDQKPFPIIGDGLSTRDYTYIDDVVRAIGNVIIKMMNGEKINDTFNIATGKETSILKIAETIDRLMHNSEKINSIKFEWLPERKIDGIHRRALNIDKAYQKLTWKPSVSLTDGLQRTLLWMKSQKKIDTYQNIS